MTGVKVVTLNTWKGDGEYHRRLGLMAEGLSRLSPELVLLQEVFASGDGVLNTGRFLAESLGMVLNYHPARRKLRRVRGVSMESASGLAILSRDRPLQRGALSLPADPMDGDRWAQWVRLVIGGSSVVVVNTHLTHLGGRDDLRRRQLEQIVSFAAGCREDDGVLLGGDFNCTPGSPPLRWLDEQGVCPAHGAWRKGTGSACPGTLNTGSRNDCIDHLYRLGSSRRVASSLKAGIAMDRPDESGLFASDHVAVFGELLI
ncbi:MAG: endonuclease/exonuclease/phosphatase family protein [Candidatus Sedimenticola sp. 6PFRAG5]